MKRHLYIIALISLITPLLTACEDGLSPAAELIGEIFDDNKPEQNAVYLSELSANNYPDTDTWIIWDSSAVTEDFAGLSAAISALNNSGRKISLEFPRIEAFPDYAIFGTSENYSPDFPSAALISVSAYKATSIGETAFACCDALTSIKFPAVTNIDHWALSACKALTSVELPKATKIEDYAFVGCEALTSIELPAITEIGERAFYLCKALTSLYIPSTVTFIGGGAFNGCDKLTDLNINAQNYIYEDGIVYSSDKSSIVSVLCALVSGDFYSDSVTSVLYSAFSNCDALTSVELPMATEVEYFAFYNCEALTSVKLPVATEIEGTAFEYCEALTSVEIPMATVIGNAVFFYCYALTSIELATADNAVLSTIDANAFYPNPTKITLTLGSANSKFVSGNTLTVGEFSKEFKEIILVDGDDNYDDGHEIDLTIFGNTIYTEDNSAEHNGVTYIYNNSYYDDEAQSISIKPNGYIYNATELIGLEKICIYEDYTFFNYTLTAGTSFDNRSQVEQIKEGNLHTYDIPSGCTFFCIENLSETKSYLDRVILYYDSLGDTTTEEPDNQFSLLADFSATNYPTDTDTWVITDSSATATDFAGLSDAINAIEPIGREISLEFPNLQAIPDYAIYGGDANSSNSADAIVSVSADVATSIGNGAFDYVLSLESIDFPAATSIGESAFSSCENLVNVNIPKTVTIGNNAFNRCEKIVTAKFPEAISIGSRSFSDCDNLEELHLATNEGVKLHDIDGSAFNITMTEQITLTLGEANKIFVNDDTLIMDDFNEEFRKIILVDENGDEVIVTPAEPFSRLADFSAADYPTDTDTWVIEDTTAETTDFAGLSAAIAALSDSGRHISLEFPNLEAIPDYAIFGKSEINSKYLSAALISVSADAATSIGSSAFRGCEALTSVELAVATAIGDSAFYDCDALTSVKFPAATAIGDSAFYHCDALTSVEIPSTVTSIGDGAFSSCNKLTTLDSNTSYYIYEDGILFTSDKSTIISALSAVVSGDIYYSTVTAISSCAFYSCKALTSVEFPAATAIGSSAFRCCEALTSVKFPAVTEIGNDVFQYCYALTSIELPVATEIGKWAFSDCDALTSLSIATDEGVMISSIDRDAFFYTTTSNITLTIGTANSQYVSGKTLTVGNFCEDFKKIIFDDDASSLGGDAGDAPDLGYEELF